MLTFRINPVKELKQRNSSGDEIANVNFLYDDTVHSLRIQETLA